MMFLSLICILSALLATIEGGIEPCVCNYHVQRNVYGTQSTAVFPVAFLYEFDCLPLAKNTTILSDWAAVVYNHKTAFMKIDSMVKQQLCNGTKPFIPLTTITVSTTKATTQTTTPLLLTTKQATPTTKTTKQTTTSYKTTHKYMTTYSPTMQPTMTMHHLYTRPTSAATAFQVKTSQTQIAQGITQTYTNLAPRPTTTRPINTGNTQHCPQRPGTHGEYGNYCYQLMVGATAWNYANNYCHQTGGFLVTVNNLEEQRYLHQFIRQNMHLMRSTVVWIGLNDIVNEGYFVWANGARTTFTNWMPGHIGNFAYPDYEDCVVMKADDGKWDDQPCIPSYPFNYLVHPFICQYNRNGVGSNYFVG